MQPVMSPPPSGITGTAAYWRVRSPLLLTGLWLLLWWTAWQYRPLWPIDETRYVAVAWEMWLRGDWLVPHLNGDPYSHKPPLLFWLIQLGWRLFGVNDWWPRLVAPLFGLGSLFMTGHLARRLWPQAPGIARSAPFILLGGAAWMVYTTLVMFDMLVAFFVLLGLHGMLSVWQERDGRGWLVLGLGIGGGMLAKGPVVMLYLLPVALLAPWWGRRAGDHPWLRWYAGLGAAVVLGTGIALAWAIPAAVAGGPEYAQAILWQQTTHRMVESFAHRQPWWWYLPLLPLLLFPWSVWPPLWRGLRRLAVRDTGIRFCMAWAFPALVALSSISGKQVHYLLPLFPAFAIVAARALRPTDVRPWDGVPVALLLGTLGIALAVLPHVSALIARLQWVHAVTLGPALGLSLLALAVAWLPHARWRHAVPAMTLVMVVLVSVVHAGIGRAAAPAYSTVAAGTTLARLHAEGRAVAHVGKYHGQYQYSGRLSQPLEVIAAASVDGWLSGHPGGRVLMYYQDPPQPLPGQQFELVQPYRGGYLAIWGRS
jgi:hypothetical protein